MELKIITSERLSVQPRRLCTVCGNALLRCTTTYLVRIRVRERSWVFSSRRTSCQFDISFSNTGSASVVIPRYATLDYWLVIWGLLVLNQLERNKRPIGSFIQLCLYST